MKKTLATISLLLSLLTANATHIVGGEFMYKYLSTSGGNKNYQVTLNLYIDCINGSQAAIDQDEYGLFNVFKVSNKALQVNLCKSVLRNTPSRVNDVNYKCIKNKPNACVDKYVYTTTISLPINDNFIVSFERCCRNNTITNIVNPSGTGATYFTTINTGNTNSSPSFKSLPPNFLCTNAPLKFDHSANDIDGDSLVYELFQPYDGAGTNTNTASRPDYNDPTNRPRYPQKLIVWENGYATYTNQIDGNPTLTIDPKTGKLTLTPTQPGQFVIGIKVKEYRKGVFIGETKRDFQFNVSICVFDVVSSFFVPSVGCTGNAVTFNNRSQGATTYLWNFGDTNTIKDTSIFTNPSYTYSKPGTYNIRLISRSNSCVDTSEYDITIKQNFKVKIPNDTLVCGPFSKLLFTNTPGKQYLWNTGSSAPSITVNKGGQYWVKVTDAPCVSSDTINITNDLFKLNLGPDSVICRDSFVQFFYQGPPGMKTYLWSDGNNQRTVFIPSLKSYWLTVTNQNDCPSSDTISFVLYSPPKIFLNDTLFCKNTSVVLNGQSYSIKTLSETIYQWNTGDTSAKIRVGLPGQYIVKVRNKLCTVFDTANIDFIQTGLDLGNDTFYCGPVDRWLRPLSTYAKYIWHDNSETINYHATSAGWKKLTIVTKEGCIESDSVFIAQYPVRDGGLGKDTAICLSAAVILTAADSMNQYWWNTGATTRSIVVESHGTYVVRFKYGQGCINADSIRIQEQPDALPIEMFMPNAFTPNDDGVNDVYPGNKYSDPGSEYNLSIYNRWGEKIFESKSPKVTWDGRYKGNLAPQDVYVFYVKYVACDDQLHWFRGTFTLLR